MKQENTSNPAAAAADYKERAWRRTLFLKRSLLRTSAIDHEKISWSIFQTLSYLSSPFLRSSPLPLFTNLKQLCVLPVRTISFLLLHWETAKCSRQWKFPIIQYWRLTCFADSRSRFGIWIIGGDDEKELALGFSTTLSKAYSCGKRARNTRSSLRGIGRGVQLLLLHEKLRCCRNDSMRACGMPGGDETSSSSDDEEAACTGSCVLGSLARSQIWHRRISNFVMQTRWTLRLVFVFLICTSLSLRFTSLMHGSWDCTTVSPRWWWRRRRVDWLVPDRSYIIGCMCLNSEYLSFPTKKCCKKCLKKYKLNVKGE